MKRRITSSYYRDRREKHLPMMKRIVFEATQDRRIQDDLMAVAERALMYALIHYQSSDNHGATIGTYVFHRVRGRCRHLRDREIQVARMNTSIADDHLGRLVQETSDPDLPILAQEMMAILNETERTVVEAMVMNGRTSRDVGAQLGVSHDTAWRIRDRALQKMRNQFASPERLAS